MSLEYTKSYIAIRRTVIVLPRKTREEQSPFLYKREQGMKSKMYKQFFSDFDEKLKKLLLRKKNIAVGAKQNLLWRNE